MSNLCSEILQVSTASTYKPNGNYKTVGRDISCNLGSLNIANTFDSEDFEKTIEVSIRSLTAVSDLSNIDAVPSIVNGNSKSHAVGLGAMNLHGFFAREHIFYDSEEALDFTNLWFYAVRFYALKASNKIAKETGEKFFEFEKSDYANGVFFEKYTKKNWGKAKTEKVAQLFKKSSIKLPTPKDWKELQADVEEYGLYNAYLLCVAPTGSISYVNYSTSSIHPVTTPLEARKEGKLGRVYSPAPFLSEDTLPYYKDAYAIGPDATIAVYAAATQHVDQGLSCTLFFNGDATTRDLSKAYITAWRSGLKTLYYARVKQKAIDGVAIEDAQSFCESCAI